MTATEITNLALGKLGANNITNLDDETLIRPTYLQALAEVLRSHDWNFALTRKALPVSAGAGPYEAAIPSDNVRISSVLAEGYTLRPTEYRIEGGVIRSNLSSLSLVYVSKNVATATFPPDFIEALCTLLAAKLAATLLKSPGMMQSMEESYITIKLPEAKRNDALDSPGGLYYDHQTPAATSPANRARLDSSNARQYGFE